MPDFQQYIGVRYSGRKDPGDPIREIKVFAARGGPRDLPRAQPRASLRTVEPAGPRGVAPRQDHRRRAGRRGDRPCLLLPPELHGPQRPEELGASSSRTSRRTGPPASSSVRELLPGNPRTGDPDEHRLTGQWTAFPKSVFQFDIQDSLAKATHAGLPWIDYLRRAGDRAHFWPFDGFEVPKGKSVVAEVRPARLRHRYRKEGLSAQEQDAYAVCAWLRERDQLGLLRPYFTPAALGRGEGAGPPRRVDPGRRLTAPAGGRRRAQNAASGQRVSRP